MNDAEKTVDISSAEGLAWFAKEINTWESKETKVSFAEYTININSDINLSGKLWEPIDPETVIGKEDVAGYKSDRAGCYNNKLLAGAKINGNGHKITGMTVETSVRGPREGSLPGDGGNAYYYSAFIGRINGDLEINDLTFENASVNANREPNITENGSSSLAVVVGYNGGGTLTLNNVKIENCTVEGEQKVGGFVGQGAGSLEVNNCRIANSNFIATYFAAPISAYAMNTQYNVEGGSTANRIDINGIQLVNNKVDVKKLNEYSYVEHNGATYFDCYYESNNIKNYMVACDTAYIAYGASQFVANRDEETDYCCVPLELSAEVNGYQYETVADAIAAAGDNETVKLLRDIELTETLVINGGKNITIDLNGKNISKDNRVITVQNAHVKFTGKGEIKETDPYYGAVVVLGSNKAEDENYTYVEIGKDVTLSGWSPVFITPYTSGTAPYAYGVKVDIYGTLNGLSDKDGGTGSAVYINGQIKHKENYPIFNIYPGAKLTSTGSVYGAGYAQWNITGGEITGIQAGIGIKSGILNISGDAVIRCTGPNTAPTEGFSNGINGSGAAIQIESNDGYAGDVEINIKGGSIISDNGYSIYEYANLGSDNIADYLKVKALNIEDGGFSGDFCVSEALAKAEPKVFSITGGHFTANPSEYVAEGKMAVPSDEGGYTYTIGDKPSTEVEAATGAPAFNDEKMSAIPAEKHDEVKKIAEAVEADTGVLGAAANTVADKITEKQQEDAVEALKGSGIAVSGNEKVYVQTYMEITPTAYDEENGTVTLDIQPMYRVVASTAEKAEDIKLDGEGENAVVLEGSEKPLTNIKTISITVTLPDEFTAAEDTTYYAKHIHEGKTYYYPLTISEGEATFLNTNGFSEISLPVNINPAASIGGSYYATLQEAVNDAGDGDTVRILSKDAELTAAMSGSSRTITVENGTDAEITVKINGEEKSIGAGESAEFTYRRPVVTKYEVNVSETENGKTEVSTAKAAAGSTVRITATADELYIVETVTVTTAEGETVEVTKVSDREYTFIMPAGDVTVKAEYKHECPSGKYTDVNENEWYHEAVDYVISHKMMIGISESEFMPKGSTSRGQIVTILYRLEKEPGVSGGTEFEDVSAGSYYAEAVKWAESNEIMLGYGDGRFGPEDGITREQLAAILYRYAEYKGYEIKGSEELTGYTDAGKVSGWAEEAMKWSCGNGLILGGDGDKLDPQGGAERSQAAAILMRFCETIGK